MKNNTNNTFDSIFDYQKAHPEKFELVKDAKKRIPYFAAAVVCLLLVVFPGIIPFCPGWLMRIVAIVGLLASAFMAWSTGEEYRCLSNGEPFRSLGSKTFRNGKDADCRQQILEAFARRDFEFLAAEPSGKGPALTLGVYEDAGARTLYLHIMNFTDEGFFGLTDVLEVSGEELTANEQLIRSLCGK